jgi:hypothetical protein
MFQGSTGNRVGVPTTLLDLGSMRQTAATGRRVSAHTHPSPVATEIGGTGRRNRATIAPWLVGGVAAVLVELGGSGDLPVEQPDAATATPTAMPASSLKGIRALT